LRQGKIKVFASTSLRKFFKSHERLKYIMPKMKTNKGAAKRFSKTGTGKIKRNKAFTSHILTSKTTKRKRNLRHSTIMSPGDTRKMRVLIPY